MDKIFQQQKEFQYLIGQPTHFITPYEKIRACNIQVRRAIDELNEAIREMPYDLSGYGKSKKVYSFDDAKVIGELVDAQLFIINALNILGINSNEFEQQCVNKQYKNQYRFESNQRFRPIKDDHLIVIEGPDGVGKTAVCELLSMKLGYSIMRMPDISIDKDIELYSQFYRRTINKIKEPLILDRFYPSSIVYGQFFNRSVLLDDLQGLINNRGVFTFIITSDQPYRSDSFIDSDQWKHINDIYLQQAKLNKWTIINNNTSLENCVQKILEKLRF
ncbi:MAG: hypothetical protein H7X88_01690 [Gloeobacteraceae cyanobacterium ES-bin-316]|nr:hypothetical protein [Ferruginibacter sp.]